MSDQSAVCNFVNEISDDEASDVENVEAESNAEATQDGSSAVSRITWSKEMIMCMAENADRSIDEVKELVSEIYRDQKGRDSNISANTLSQYVRKLKKWAMQLAAADAHFSAAGGKCDTQLQDRELSPQQLSAFNMFLEVLIKSPWSKITKDLSFREQRVIISLGNRLSAVNAAVKERQDKRSAGQRLAKRQQERIEHGPTMLARAQGALPLPSVATTTSSSGSVAATSSSGSVAAMSSSSVVTATSSSASMALATNQLRATQSASSTAGSSSNMDPPSSSRKKKKAKAVPVEEAGTALERLINDSASDFDSASVLFNENLDAKFEKLVANQKLSQEQTQKLMEQNSDILKQNQALLTLLTNHFVQGKREM